MRTIEEVKAEFAEHGVTIAGWARANGYESEHVRAVLSGKAVGHHGAAHAIAVELGLKKGVIKCDAAKRMGRALAAT